MAIFKCKMCGGTLEINVGETVATCEYCGTKQTLPKLDDEKKANLFDRANHFRRNNDFDKAMGIYEQILNEDTEDAESYWSIVLCRYGIEYVEDPSSRKRVPTVNRAQFTSVFDDEDYKSAIKYADSYQKNIYEAEAAAINEIQKGILAISQKEEPFDVFICYKETDNNGRRTQDSVLATELYHELTKEGFKVFFSRITLEDKLGIAYEPYIFAALNSAKVMVVLGTKQEHFNAVWVKNEWSRFLALIKNGANKILIPAYRDMDPYDLPEEFSHLQAQDMSKLGFMQDLVRGIKKLATAGEQKHTVVRETVETKTAVSTAPMLERAFMFLEDGDWNSADEYCEKVLDMEPKCARAYLGKLMAELKIHTEDNLCNCKEPFDIYDNYAKAMRFGDENLKKKLESDIEHINSRNENEEIKNIYEEACRQMDIAKMEIEFKMIADEFDSISEYKDSRKLSEKCLEKAEIARKKAEKERKLIDKIVLIVVAILCVIIAFITILNTVIIPNNKYNKAIGLYEAEEYIDAFVILQKLDDYKESKKISENIIHQMPELALLNHSVGETVFLGEYEQDGNLDNGKEPIEWIILDKNADTALLVSKYCLDSFVLNDIEGLSVNWENCKLNNWLQDDFKSNAFKEYNNLDVVEISILSLEENEMYFGSVESRKTSSTTYCDSKKAVEFYWTKSLRYYDHGWAVYASCVKFLNGYTDEEGFPVTYQIGVRPSMCLNISSLKNVEK